MDGNTASTFGAHHHTEQRCIPRKEEEKKTIQMLIDVVALVVVTNLAAVHQATVVDVLSGGGKQGCHTIHWHLQHPPTE